MDTGILCGLSNNMTIGLNIQSVLSLNLKLSDATDEYPLTVVALAGYRLINQYLFIELDANKTAKRSYKLHLGAEYSLMKVFSLRAGINENELACGLGFRLRDYFLD